MEFLIQYGGGIFYPYMRYATATVVGDHIMEMYLQFGHGMMAHTRELLRQWKSGGVILSPRDLTEDQLQRTASEISKMGREVLIDPQCFARDSDHARLTSHTYWKIIKSLSTGAFSGGDGTAALLQEVATLARNAGVHKHILPGLLATPVVSEDWFTFQEIIIEEAPSHFSDEPLYATVALSSPAMLDEVQVEAVVERASGWNVSGFYVVAESPSGYLVDNPVWLANLLLLVSGLKLLNKRIIVGYCNHQMLCLAAANADVIASGTWLNVRAFPPDKFYSPEEGDVSRRATWFYCPQALSEFKLPFLDIAARAGILNEMAADSSLGSTYATPLFTGAIPSTVNWSEQESFRHYLTCLSSQVNSARKSSFQLTLESQQQELDSAETFLSKLHRNGVFGQDRDFGRIFDVNRSALITFANARGHRLRRSW